MSKQTNLFKFIKRPRVESEEENNQEEESSQEENNNDIFQFEDELELSKTTEKIDHRSRPKNLAKFHGKYKKEFEFIIDSLKGINFFRCRLCEVDLSLGRMGKKAIEQNNKHKEKFQIYNEMAPLQRFGINKVCGSDLSLAAEGTWAYHTLVHHHSLNSASCCSELFQDMFPKSEAAERFASGRNKTTAIIKGVLSEYFLNERLKELGSKPFSVSVDSSGFGYRHLVPILIRFLGSSGVQTFVLDLIPLISETSRDFTDVIKESLSEYNLKSNMMVGYCGDNAPVNFGGAERRGKKNVFRLLKEEVNESIVGVGCTNHIVHNAASTAAGKMRVSVETIANEIASFFDNYPLRIKTLAEYCIFVEIEPLDLQRSGQTRWITLHPLLEKILKMWPALVSYFSSEDETPKRLKQVFSEKKQDETECYFSFMHCVLNGFNEINSSMQRESYSFIEAIDDFDEFQENLIKRKQKRVYGTHTLTLLNRVKEDSNQKAEKIEKDFQEFFDNVQSYLNKWLWFDKEKVSGHQWMALKQETTTDLIKNNTLFEQMQKTIKQFSPALLENDEGIFKDTLYLEKVLPQLMEDESFRTLPLDRKWCRILLNKDLHVLPTLVQTVLAIPASNAPCERVFSLLNIQWSPERRRLTDSSMRAFAIVLYNTKFRSCREAFQAFRSNKELLKKIKTSEKYNVN